MGALQSKQRDMTKSGIRQRRHDPLFFKGMAAAEEGRYTDAELYFHEVLFQHPEFKRYSSFIIGVEQQLSVATAVATMAAAGPGTKSTTLMEAHKTKVSPDATPEDPNVDGNQVFLEELDATANDGERNETFAPLSEGMTIADGQPSTTTAETEMPFPVGKDLENLLEFFQLQQDVEYVYTSCNTDKAFELAMLYAQMNCIWQQFNCYLITKVRKERAGLMAASGSDSTGSVQGLLSNDSVSKKSATTANHAALDNHDDAGEEKVEFMLDMFEQICLIFLINSSVNYGSLALMLAERLGKQHQQQVSLSLKAKSAAERKAAAKEQQHIVRRQERIYNNVSDLCQVLVDVLWEYSLRSPDDYVNKVLLKILPPHGHRASELFSSLSIPTDHNSETESSHATTMDAKTQHALSFLTEAFKRVGSRRDGGTFLADSRALNPYMPIVIPFEELKLRIRIAVPKLEKLSLSDLAKFEAPMFREAWHSTKWLLPGGAAGVTAYPATSSFLLTRALPQYFTEAEGGAVAFTKHPIPDRHVPSAGYVDTLLEYVLSRNASDDAAQLAAIRAASGTSATTAEDKMQRQPNKNIDLMVPAMRHAVLMDETAMCVKMVFILMAKVKRLLGDSEGCRLMASTVVMGSACLRGPNSAERLRTQGMMEEMGLL